MKYESPTTYGSRDIAQVKVLSTDNDNDDDAGGMALALWDYCPGELKSWIGKVNHSAEASNCIPHCLSY